MTAQPAYEATTASPDYEPLESTDSAPKHGPTYEEIEQRAYHLWQERLKNGIHGTSEDDWFEAERQLSQTSTEAEP